MLSYQGAFSALETEGPTGGGGIFDMGLTIFFYFLLDTILFEKFFHSDRLVFFERGFWIVSFFFFDWGGVPRVPSPVVH